MKKINKKMSIGKILEICPEAAEIMEEAGLSCFGCPMAQMESLEDGAMGHGRSEKRIKDMVEKINNKISNDE